MIGGDDDLHLYVNDYEYEDSIDIDNLEINPEIVNRLAEQHVCPTLRDRVTCNHLDYETLDVFNPKTNRWIMHVPICFLPSEMIIDQPFLDFVENGLSKWNMIEHVEPRFGNEQWRGALEFKNQKQ